MTNPIERMVNYVLHCHGASLKRGALPMWTVYDRPRDKPSYIVVRKFEISGGSEPIVTDDILEAYAGEDGLAVLRTVLERAGLHRLSRNAADHPNVVETWI